MKKVLLLVVIGLVIIGVANSGGGGGAPEARPGNAAVYARIASMTDCGELQAEFDQADANGKADRARGALPLAKISTAYMGAADARMRAVGCY